MSATYSIRVEPWGFLRFTLSGLFDSDTFARFVADRGRAFARLTCSPNEHLTLVDLTDCLLQPQILASAFQQLMADHATRSRRMAFVFGQSPARMQVRRILAQRDDIGLFVTEAEAMAWLTGPAKKVA